MKTKRGLSAPAGENFPVFRSSMGREGKKNVCQYSYSCPALFKENPKIHVGAALPSRRKDLQTGDWRQYHRLIPFHVMGYYGPARTKPVITRNHAESVAARHPRLSRPAKPSRRRETNGNGLPESQSPPPPPRRAQLRAAAHRDSVPVRLRLTLFF